MAVLASSRALSAVWARPVRLPFFEDNAPYLSSFEGFNLASKLDTEKTIAERGNSCNDANPVLVDYDRCSKYFTSLWTEAASSMQVGSSNSPVGAYACLIAQLTCAHRTTSAGRARPSCRGAACSCGPA